MIRTRTTIACIPATFRRGRASRRFLVTVTVMLAGLLHVAGQAAAVGTTNIVVPDAYVCSEQGHVDFEQLADGTNLSATAFPGIQFTTTGGYTWLVGDFATGFYNGKFPDGAYTSQGTHWAWLGIDQGTGRIDLTAGKASSFSLLTSTATPVSLEAYDASGGLLDVAGPSPVTTETPTMAELRIARPTRDISYLVVHDTGNYFEVDEICTDAPLDDSADLAVSQSDAPDPAEPGETLTYTVTVSNVGPGDATDVELTDTLPTVGSIASADWPGGACTLPPLPLSSAPVVTCDLGDLPEGESVDVTIEVELPASGSGAAAGPISNLAAVTAAETDPDASNNQTSEQTIVRGVRITTDEPAGGYRITAQPAMPTAKVGLEAVGLPAGALDSATFKWT